MKIDKCTANASNVGHGSFISDVIYATNTQIRNGNVEIYSNAGYSRQFPVYVYSNPAKYIYNDGKGCVNYQALYLGDIPTNNKIELTFVSMSLLKSIYYSMLWTPMVERYCVYKLYSSTTSNYLQTLSGYTSGVINRDEKWQAINTRLNKHFSPTYLKDVISRLKAQKNKLEQQSS